MTIQLVARTKDEASAGIRTMRGEVENLNSPLKTVAKNTDTWTAKNKELSDKIGLVKSSVKALGAIAGAIGTAWTWLEKTSGGMRKLANEAGQAQIENQRLQFATESAGLSWDKVSKQADGFIDAMMRTTRFSDENLKASLQMGIRLFHDYGIAERMTATATDFAASTGKGFIQAQQDIRRVLEGSTASIRRYDATLADLMDTNLKLLPPQTALTKNLALMEERFKGAAQRDLENYTSLLIQQTNAVQNLRQTIGSLLLPIFSVLAKNWTNFIFMLDEAIKKSEGFKRIGAIFTEVGEKLRGDADANSKFIEVLVKIIDRLGITIELVIKHIFAIAEAFGFMAGEENKAADSSGRMNDLLDNMGKLVLWLVDKIENNLLKAIDGIGVAIIKARSQLEVFIGFLKVVGATFVYFGTVATQYAVAGFEKIIDVIPKVMGFLNKFVNLIGDVIIGLSQSALVPEESRDSFTKMGQSIHAVGLELQKATADVTNWNNGLKGSIGEKQVLEENLAAKVAAIQQLQRDIVSYQPENVEAAKEVIHKQSARGFASPEQERQAMAELKRLNKAPESLIKAQEELKRQLGELGPLRTRLAEITEIELKRDKELLEVVMKRVELAAKIASSRQGVSPGQLNELSKLKDREDMLRKSAEGPQKGVFEEIGAELEIKKSEAARALLETEKSYLVLKERENQLSAEALGLLAEKSAAITKTEFKGSFVSEQKFTFAPEGLKLTFIGESPVSTAVAPEIIGKNIADAIYSMMIKDPNFRELFTKGTRKDQQEMMEEIYRQMMETIRGVQMAVGTVGLIP